MASQIGGPSGLQQRRLLAPLAGMERFTTDKSTVCLPAGNHPIGIYKTPRDYRDCAGNFVAGHLANCQPLPVIVLTYR
jgi:hypothetical protein